MKILFLTLSYSEKNHISFYEELLQEFINNGHEVYVACAVEKRKKIETNLTLERNIQVLRIKTGNITGNKNMIEKGISTLTIDSKFIKAVKKYFDNVKFDLVLYPTPPITLVNTVKYIKKRDNAKTYLLLKDIFPQNAVDLGMMKKTGLKGIVYKIFREKEKSLYKMSDYIGCMSPANVQYVLTHNPEIYAKSIEVCPNCVKPIKYDSDIDIVKTRTLYNIPQNKKVFVYGGNLGKPQGIDFFLECLNECKDINDVYFVIIGGGSESQKIFKYINDNHINNAQIINTLPKDEYESFVRACDVGLVFLDYRFTIPNFPSRILSYMQASKPIIVATDKNTDMGIIVETNNFGWKCDSNNSNMFRNSVTEALNSDLEYMGNNARRYLEENYDVKNGYSIIINHFDRE